MIKSVNQYNIGQLFMTNNNAYYVIPKYQREYTWGQSHWEALYDDICENDLGYFIGSIICISHSTDSMQATPLEVVDGQQRLTTICLLLSALYKKMSEYKGQMDEEQSSDVFNVKNCIFKKNLESKVILIPQDQNHNREDFNYALKEAGIITTAPKVNYYGLRAISRCYNYFLKQIQEDLDESSNPIDTLFSIKEKVIGSVLVKIEVDTHADAYVMFESLNNRGASLTAVDLMKNAALAKASRFNMDVDDCFSQWQEILNYISNDYSSQERFFRFNYNSFRKDLNKPFKTEDSTKTFPLGDLATKSNLLSIYEKLIDYDLTTFLDEIKSSAEIYHQFLEPDCEDAKYSKELNDLNHIQGISGYILLLYLLKNQTTLSIEDSTISSIIKFLCNFFVRRNITDQPPTRDLNRMFMELISNIEDKGLKGEAIETETRSLLISRSASDELFKEKLLGDIYLENVGVTRYALCALEEKTMTAETKRDLWAQKISGGKMYYIWTIEHIFPEGENVPDSWVDMIADGDKAKAADLRSRYCHKIGNLTLTGYNSYLSNMSFEKKKTRVDDNGNFIGYKNGLSLNKDLATYDDWTIDKIESRTDSMVKDLIEMFKLQ